MTVMDGRRPECFLQNVLCMISAMTMTLQRGCALRLLSCRATLVDWHLDRSFPNGATQNILLPGSCMYYPRLSSSRCWSSSSASSNKMLSCSSTLLDTFVICGVSRGVKEDGPQMNEK